MILNSSNFVLYAAKHYDNPHCLDIDEFHEDLKRIKYIKRLFNRFEITKDLKERLILNHIIILYNAFGIEAATKMLFFKLKGYYEYLKPFLVLLNFLPERVEGIESTPIITSDIKMDSEIISRLRKI